MAFRQTAAASSQGRSVRGPMLKEKAQTPLDEAELDYGAVDADGTIHGAPGLGLDVRLIALLHAKVCLATLVPELALDANVVLFGNQPMEGLFPRPLASALVQVARQEDCLVCRPLRGELPPALMPRR